MHELRRAARRARGEVLRLDETEQYVALFLSSTGSVLYCSLLVESQDFASGTSSQSTKLVHGGLRYLRQGQFLLTRKSVRERERLLEEGAGLVDPLAFCLAAFPGDEMPKWMYGVGLAMYDALAGKWAAQGAVEEASSGNPHARRLRGHRRLPLRCETDDARLVTAHPGPPGGGHPVADRNRLHPRRRPSSDRRRKGPRRRPPGTSRRGAGRGARESGRRSGSRDRRLANELRGERYAAPPAGGSPPSPHLPRRPPTAGRGGQPPPPADQHAASLSPGRAVTIYSPNRRRRWRASRESRRSATPSASLFFEAVQKAFPRSELGRPTSSRRSPAYGRDRHRQGGPLGAEGIAGARNRRENGLIRSPAAS